MRSIKLVPALAAAAALVCLAPTGASARPNLHRIHRHAGASGTCHPTLTVAPHLITAGESVVAFGHLTCSAGNTGAGQTVTLYQQSAGSPAFTVVGSAVTDIHGFYDITAPSVTTDSTFYTLVGATQSGHRAVRVAAQVTLAGPSEGSQILASLQTGRRSNVTFTGSVSPSALGTSDVGSEVVLQRQNAITGNEWRRIGHGIVSVGGTFAIAHTFRIPGDANLRVVLRGNHKNVASPSNVLTYEISQAQVPGLSINTSGDPSAYGQAVTISGVSTPNTELTLWSHPTKNPGFAPGPQVKTDASGNYTFPSQMPLTNTFYEVRGGGRTSAILFQAVRDTLTATLSPSSTVAAGETLTFSGNVSPDHTGHVIYLERQNTSGPNFHVVEVGVIGAGSVYSIPHTVFTAGTFTFRVKIPGDGENGATASQLFTVTVTPPKEAALLTPEGPSNSSLPPEGQL